MNYATWLDKVILISFFLIVVFLLTINLHLSLQTIKKKKKE